MLITPNEIATKDFKKVAVGYSPEEVDTFLDDLYEDYEKLFMLKQKGEAKAEPKDEPVAQDTERLQRMEKTIERTLTLAEAAAEETRIAAKSEATQIVQGAKMQAEEVLSATRKREFELEQDIAALSSRYELMKARVKLLLYAEIELLDKDEILAEKEEKTQQ